MSAAKTAGRTTRPTRSKLPWEGPFPPAGAERPLCKGCSRHLKPVVLTRYEQVEQAPPGSGFYHRAAAEHWDGRWDSYGGFCSLRCALAFAVAAWETGTRVKGGRR